jgi:hypothetical protein
VMTLMSSIRLESTLISSIGQAAWPCKFHKLEAIRHINTTPCF